jgi:hypothetical protein
MGSVEILNSPEPSGQFQLQYDILGSIQDFYKLDERIALTLTYAKAEGQRPPFKFRISLKATSCNHLSLSPNLNGLCAKKMRPPKA